MALNIELLVVFEFSSLPYMCHCFVCLFFFCYEDFFDLYITVLLKGGLYLTLA